MVINRGSTIVSILKYLYCLISVFLEDLLTDFISTGVTDMNGIVTFWQDLSYFSLFLGSSTLGLLFLLVVLLFFP